VESIGGRNSARGQARRGTGHRDARDDGHGAHPSPTTGGHRCRARAREAGGPARTGRFRCCEDRLPQYGGLRDASASVMTVAEQTWLTDTRLRHRTLTIDVRLSRAGDRWVVTKLLPAQVVDVAELTLSGDVAALLVSPRLALPDAAVADLAGGVVDSLVIEALLQLSEGYEMSVSVFRSGHPRNVFGTDRTSNHTRGRAVDIWAINGVPVVAMTTTDPVLSGFITAARELGSDEIGAPVDPDGPGGVHFADDVHRDHVHIGFRV
jgi:hypothetical protein